MKHKPSNTVLQGQSLVHCVDDFALWPCQAAQHLTCWPSSEEGPLPDTLVSVDGTGKNIHSISSFQEWWWEENQGRAHWGHSWFPKIHRCRWETSGQEVILSEFLQWGYLATPSGKKKTCSSTSVWLAFESSGLWSNKLLHTVALPRVFWVRQITSLISKSSWSQVLLPTARDNTFPSERSNY